MSIDTTFISNTYNNMLNMQLVSESTALATLATCSSRYDVPPPPLSSATRPTPAMGKRSLVYMDSGDADRHHRRALGRFTTTPHGVWGYTLP